MDRGLGLVRFQVRPPGSTQRDGRCFLAKAVVLDTEVHAGEGGFPRALPPSKGSPAFFNSPWISHLKSTSLEIPARACRVIVGLLINARPLAAQGGGGRGQLPLGSRKAWKWYQHRDQEGLASSSDKEKLGGRKLGGSYLLLIEEELGGRVFWGSGL